MKGFKIYIICSAVALILYVTAQYYKPQPTDWSPTYAKEDKIPFGLYLLYQQRADIFPDADIKLSRLPAYNTLKNKSLHNTSYLIAGNSIKLDEVDYKELIRFVNDGNSAFLAAYDFSDLLRDSLHMDVKTAGNMMDEINTPVNFVNSLLKSPTAYRFNKGIAQQYFSKLDTTKVTVLGTNADGNPNFIKYASGKGAIYILPNPQLLTNFSLLSPGGAEYAARALSYLPASSTLIWDEYGIKGPVTKTDNVLRFIFENTQLTWAYTLSVAGLLIFVLFQMKRRQRIIPIVSPLKNSSVDFVKVIGKVYYQQRDNQDIVQKKISYLLEHIRSIYRIKTTVLDEELTDTLIVRSGAEEEVVRKLFRLIAEVTALKKVNDQQLIELNKLIEKFYRQAR